MGKLRTVWKFDLPMTSVPGEILPLRLPAGAKILKVGEQGEDPLSGPRLFVWALVDPNEEFHELRYVVTAPTGYKFEVTTLSKRDWDYVDTVLCMGSRLVVHVWVSRPDGKHEGRVEVSADNA